MFKNTNTQDSSISLHRTLSQDHYIPNSVLGYKVKSNATSKSLMTVNQDTIFNITYHTDSLGRRINPNNESKENPNSKIIFFGGSFVEGYGLEDYQTLPYFFSQEDTNTYTYNYGVGGYGTAHLLAQLENIDWEKEIKDTQIPTTAIYVFIDHHVHRAFGDMSVTLGDNNKMPWYSEEDGKFVRKGFLSDQYWKIKLFQVLSYSYVLKLMDFSYPKIDEDELEWTARLIAQTRDTYQKKFGNNHFFVIISPFSFYDLKSPLEAKNVKVLDYSQLLGKSRFEKEGWVIPHDFHPNAKSNEAVSKQLYKDLKLYLDLEKH